MGLGFVKGGGNIVGFMARKMRVLEAMEEEKETRRNWLEGKEEQKKPQGEEFLTQGEKKNLTGWGCEFSDLLSSPSLLPPQDTLRDPGWGERVERERESK